MGTTGIGVQAKIAVDASSVSLSLGGTNTHQINPQVQDVANTEQSTSTVLTLSSVAASVGGTAVYTGTITGGGSNAFAGFVFIIAGFTNGVNNGTFLCTASTATTLTLVNAVAVLETHAGTATSDDAVAFAFISRNPAVATVSATGLITGVIKGGTVIEVSYPTFGNSEGKASDGSYADKIYAEIDVTVVA